MTNLQDIVEKSDNLHAKLPELKTGTDTVQVDEEILSRRRFVSELRKMLREERKMKNAIEIDARRRKAEVQETIDALSGLLALHEDDNRELTDYRWQLVDEKREARSSFSPSSSQL